MSSLATLADDLGVNERTLRRAASQGALRAERPSPRTLTLPPGEIGYLRRHWPLLAALRRALRTEPNVGFAMLFGSVARGDDSAESDIDLLVALHDQSLSKVAELQDRLEQALGRRVDMSSLEAASGNELLMTLAIEEGRVLVDREELWTELRSKLTDLNRRSERAAPSERRAAKEITDGLASLPREHEALEYAMAAFGSNFDLKQLKQALAPSADMALYSQAQALERAVTRVQNILADLAIAGARLGGLRLPAIGAGVADRSFEAMKEEGVIGARLSRRLRGAQRMRNLIEHDYGNVSAGDLHHLAQEVRALGVEFTRPFRDWVEPLL